MVSESDPTRRRNGEGPAPRRTQSPAGTPPVSWPYDQENQTRSERMAPPASRGWMVVLAFSVAATRAGAQWLDPDASVTCPDKRIHFAAGVGLDLLARGPWVAKPFHDHAWKRVLVTATVAASCELLHSLEARREGKAGRPGYGFG